MKMVSEVTSKPSVCALLMYQWLRLLEELRGVRHAYRRELHVQEVVWRFDKELYGTVYDKWINRHQSVWVQRENTLRNFKPTEHVQLLHYLIQR